METFSGIRDAVILFFLYVTGTVANIDKLDLIMPRYAIKGGDVTLRCEHSVPNEQLYKVEWQKGGNKIFQYIKGRTPPYRLFPTMLPGAVLNKTNSSAKQLQLSNLDFAASGSYSCVVSMETPIFSKDSESHDLIVIDPQRANPNITFSKERYEVGELLEANCTSAPSQPAARITWFINDQKAPDDLTKSFSNDKVYGHGHFDKKMSTTTQLSVEVSELHVGEDGELRLTCMATIPAYIKDDRKNYADKREHTVRIIVENTEPPLKEPRSPNNETANMSTARWSQPYALPLLLFLSFCVY